MTDILTTIHKGTIQGLAAELSRTLSTMHAKAEALAVCFQPADVLDLDLLFKQLNDASALLKSIRECHKAYREVVLSTRNTKKLATQWPS